mgnify:CR=1 FL=1
MGWGGFGRWSISRRFKSCVPDSLEISSRNQSSNLLLPDTSRRIFSKSWDLRLFLVSTHSHSFPKFRIWLLLGCVGSQNGKQRTARLFCGGYLTKEWVQSSLVSWIHRLFLILLFILYNFMNSFPSPRVMDLTFLSSNPTKGIATTFKV